MGGVKVIVLDTHALIWWVNGDKQLSAAAQRIINRALKSRSPLLISTISAWEISMLVAKDRLALTMEVGEWLHTVAAIEGVQFVPVDNDLALQSVQLPGEFHADPADRMIVALARRHSFPLVTADRRIQAYKFVKTVW